MRRRIPPPEIVSPGGETLFQRRAIGQRRRIINNTGSVLCFPLVSPCRDNSEAKRRLGWKPSIKFEDLVKMMVEADLERLEGKIRPCILTVLTLVYKV